MSFPLKSGTGPLHGPQAPNKPEHPRTGESAPSSKQEIVRVFTASLRATGEREYQEILHRLRSVAGLCAQFGNELLTANYLLYRHKGDEDPALQLALIDAATEATGRYRAWGDRLTAYCRDAIARRVTGLIKSKGREVLRGEVSLPTFRRRGAILVRDRGVRLWRGDDKKLRCSIKVEPGAEAIEIQLWVKNLHGYYATILEKLLTGEYPIGQAQIVLGGRGKVTVKLAYKATVELRADPGTCRIANDQDNGFILEFDNGRKITFGFDVLEAARKKQAIEARRVQCWRLIRGRRLKKRRARIYRSGTLARLSSAWMDYQRTWSQQLATAIVAEAVKAKCGSVAVPSPGTLAEWFPSQLDWTLVRDSIQNACERAGLGISRIETESEQKRDLRKQERKERKKDTLSQQDAKPLQ